MSMLLSFNLNLVVHLRACSPLRVCGVARFWCEKRIFTVYAGLVELSSTYPPRADFRNWGRTRCLRDREFRLVTGNRVLGTKIGRVFSSSS